MLEQQTKLYVVPMKADKSKTIRLQMVLHLFESLRIHFKEGAWQDELYDQLTQFPLHPHDDYVDSLVHGLLYYLVNLDSNYRQAIGDNHNVTKPPNPNSSGFEYAKTLDRDKYVESEDQILYDRTSNKSRPTSIIPNRRNRIGSRGDMWTL